MPPPSPGRPDRSSASQGTRARILTAARDLAVEEGFRGFTVEKVAERAGVSRMTVYYQFGSKHQLLEALFDHLAARGRMERLAEAFQRPDPLEGLAAFIDVFCGFWGSDRSALRSLRAWAALESESGEGGHARDAWRREGLEVLVGRIRERYGVPPEDGRDAIIDVLHALTGFETFDSLARGGRDEKEIADLLYTTVRAILGVD